MKKLIHKKEGNIIFPKGEIWKTDSKSVEIHSSLEGSTGNVVSISGVSERDRQSYTSMSVKDLIVNYGAVACLMVVMGGTFYFNQDQLGLDDSRALAEYKERERKNRQFQGQLLEDLNIGKRDLSSIGDSRPSIQEDVLLERKADFKEILKSYRVRFNSLEKVKSIQLRSRKEPLVLLDVQEWVKQHWLFFPRLSFVNQNLEGSYQKFVFQSGNQFFHFKLNEDQQLISLDISEEK